MDRLPGDAIGDWFSFSKCRNTDDVCMDDGPSSLKKWKDKFFLINRRAIPDFLTWRHFCSCVLDDLPTDGYDRHDVERLCARLICLREMREEVLVRSGLSSVWFNKECDLVNRRIDDNSEMSIYDFMTLPSWGDAKVVEESHHLSSSLLDRVSSHTTASIADGAMILFPTEDEIVASLLDPRLAKKRKLRKRASEPGSSALKRGQTKGVNEADLTDFCAKIKNSLERGEGTSARVVSVPTPRLGKRLGAPSSVADVSAFGLSHVRTSIHASISGRSLSLGGAVIIGHVRTSRAEISKDDFGTATRGEEIELTLFFLAPDVCRKALDRTIRPVELRRTESLLLLELSNRVNVLSTLLFSHGYDFNSCYTNLVSSRARLQEKLDQKKGDVMLLCSEVTSLDNKLKKLKRDYDALGQENRELCSKRDVASEEVKKLQSQLTDAKAASVGMPISAGMTASVLYARLNSVSLLLALGVVLWAHSTFGNSSNQAPLFWCILVLIPCIMLRLALSTASFA
nr:hypothetical protein [Tanacetum cinerariifolium]